MKNEFQLLDALDEEVLHDEATEEPSYDLYYKNNETGDFGFYGLSTPSKEEAIEAAKECKAEKPHCDYFVMTDIDDCIFSTKSQNKAMEQLGETVKIVPDHKTSLDLLNHDLGEKINPELYKPFGHDSYDSGYIHEPEMPDWYDPEEDEPSMLPPDADDEDYDDDFDFELEEDYKQGGERTFTPDEPEYAKIKAVASIMKNDTTVHYAVTGFCDKTGSQEYNQALSEKRAEAVKKALIKYGVKEEQITINGNGYDKPFSDGRLSVNRRVSFYRNF